MNNPLNRYTKGGWLIAARGSGGGLQLAAHTPATRIGEIVRYTEYTCALAECFTPPSNTCPIAPVCCLKPVLYLAQKAFFDVLDGVSVQEMARNPAELRPIFLARSKPSQLAVGVLRG